jgi:hypothetical protein
MTVLAHVENGTVTGVYDLLPENWRNISNFSALNLEADKDFLTSLGWRVIQKASTPFYNEYSQQLSMPTYTYDASSNSVIETINVIDLPNNPITPAQIANPISSEDRTIMDHNVAMQTLRTKRDMLLAETDYTQLADIVKANGKTLTADYATYRQSLRDLPSTYENDSTFTNPDVVVYPVKPGGV